MQGQASRFFQVLIQHAEFLGIVCLITTVINTFKDLEDCTTLHKQFASLYVKANSSGAIHTAWTKNIGMETPNYFGNQMQIKIIFSWFSFLMEQLLDKTKAQNYFLVV